MCNEYDIYYYDVIIKIIETNLNLNVNFFAIKITKIKIIQ
jgi:hypothetical protein